MQVKAVDSTPSFKEGLSPASQIPKTYFSKEVLKGETPNRKSPGPEEVKMPFHKAMGVLDGISVHSIY